ncbi:hypothetical protein TNCV_746691 [Trichonephila clavipes]|nr:hypothetical protein TNCV_746691 [Trichonephila clavipes]
MSFLQLLKLGKRLLGTTLFHAFMKRTFYGHFVAGQDERRSCPSSDTCTPSGEEHPRLFRGGGSLRAAGPRS